MMPASWRWHGPAAVGRDTPEDNGCGDADVLAMETDKPDEEIYGDEQQLSIYYVGRVPGIRRVTGKPLTARNRCLSKTNKETAATGNNMNSKKSASKSESDTQQHQENRTATVRN